MEREQLGGAGFGDGRIFPEVHALAVSGSDLYAGGGFTTAGGSAANGIAKWDGSSWSALGSGMNGTVRALAVSGSDLYAGGYFTTAGGSAANRIAKWNGSSWTALGSGMGSGRVYSTPTPAVIALAVLGSDLYAAGEFTTAGGKVSAYAARAYLGPFPSLFIARSESDIVLSWPTNAPGFTLQSTTNLNWPILWSDSTNTPVAVGTNFTVTNATSPAAQFFRLKQP
jgi:hypothetical protein